jgi:MYXO-CTERM domain-containing protein
MAGSAAAQTQVKPYFLVVFDTSGSMADPPDLANSCGFTPARKLNAAKCVLGKIVNATGDAEFGLMQFAKGTNNTTCSGGSTCGPVPEAAWLRVPIQTNSATAMTPLMDNVGAGPVDELCSGGYTPLGGTLVAARDYFEGELNYTGNGLADPAPTENDEALACRPLAVILLTDGAECCNTCMGAWSGCPKTSAAVGMPNLCQTSCGNMVASCSAAEHFENAPDRAYELLTETSVPSANGDTLKQIRTYVIGFGIAAGDPGIEHIALGGGTDNPSDGAGGLRGFYANNEAALSLAFSQIIADAQPPPEVCNNLDDDCDTLIDEGIPKYCDKPMGITDPATCDGATDPNYCCNEPAETLCDGEDDDCDGLIDEGVLNVCGMCGDPPPEICDGLDNDCDSRVDEGTDGGECGSDVGRCQKGELRCIGGVVQCRGEIGPRDEVCNCEDDDCDGMIDEDITGDLCPDGKCIACECVPRCTPAVEFMPVCGEGRRPEVDQDTGECFCIIDNCDAPECAASTLEREGVLACAPDNPEVAPCLCRAGNCAARCDGVTCGTGDTCNRRTGRCVEDNCRGLGCPAGGQLCDPLDAQCVTDPCADVTCERNQACRDGRCEASCAGVVCAERERCAAGSCVTDLCMGVRCDSGDLCDPRSGECVDNPCLNPCSDGLVCSVSSRDCVRDRCWNVRCPAGQRCDDGECRTGPAGGPSGGGDPNDDAARVLAAGGGGCACQAAGSRPAGPGGASKQGLWALVALALALLLRARRRRSPGALLAAGCTVAVLLFASGCQVTPFCIDCVDASPNGAGQGGNGAAGTAGDDGDAGSDGGDDPDGGDDAGPDSGLPPCTEPEAETCDGTDQDCDFIVDEEVVADVNDCIQFGLCAGTEPICVAGAFECRYPDEREDDETLCDAIDNDCDNRVDESHPELGTACDLGVGACATQGEQVCGDDHLTLRCDGTPLDPTDELCDGLDNDCDTMIDEPRSAPGDSPSFVVDDVVEISASLFIYRYEASRPDARAPDAMPNPQGVNNSRACSRAGVLPWTNLTFQEAQDACAAADMRLCTDDEWQTICDGPSNNCRWSYTPSGGSCPTAANGYPANASPTNKLACNGHDLTATPGSPDVDALAAAGAYPLCFVTFGGEDVFDLSGNAKEWTVGANSPAENPLRGGSYNNLPGGMECAFDFAVAGPAVRLRNVGFRCCSDSLP